ncbi:Unknown protein [Striga hermonthica]|uniref:Uncharacterized protein n=1 Tax=Striga hermonthica TaxID=68872 RepID=A0A9N7RP06_STRHE|nr:Unknown protein [Striga hermonthica]
MKLLKQYNHYHYYNYAEEYEFSASSTPLFGFQRKNIGRASFKKLYPDFSMFSKCLGSFGGEEKDNKMYCLEMGFEVQADLVGDREWTAEIGSWDDDESVDERAERFIQRFYEDMREQRKELIYVN